MVEIQQVANIEQREGELDFDFEGVILRRADPDDYEEILNLMEVGEDDNYGRMYCYPNVLKLIETAYLAITVSDREGNVVGFAAFEDYPTTTTQGMSDDSHFNYWEEWFKKAYHLDEFSAFNTLWLTYFISGGSIEKQHQEYVFKQILQTVYTSIPDLVGILFLSRGDCETEDFDICFSRLSGMFNRLKRVSNVAFETVRGIDYRSEIYFSKRISVLPFIEIRRAKQEDHDDLADVFNSQSETITEAYGEYFLAELIANQNETNTALVAQVKDKAVGILGLTKTVDLKLLHKCFELDPFDNLLKAEYMDAIRARRELLIAQKRREEENKKIDAQILRYRKTLEVGLIAQRIELQEHFIAQEADIIKSLDDLFNNEELYKTMDVNLVQSEFIFKWLEGFEIRQPDEYFTEMGIDEDDIVTNVLTPLNFLIKTLEIYGLPQDYMKGGGHHLNWDKKALEASQAKNKRAKKAPPTKSSKAAKKNEQRKAEKLASQKPTHFDLEPFKLALKRFLHMNSRVRSQIRTIINNHYETVKGVFKDEHDEQSFQRCVDIVELSKKIQDAGVPMDHTWLENIGPTLICFGDIQLDEGYGERVPPETEEQRKSKLKWEKIMEKRKAEEAADKKKLKTADENKAKIVLDEEEKKEIEELERKMKPYKPQKVLLNFTSIHDLNNAVDKMAVYDRLMTELGKNEVEYNEENASLVHIGKPWVDNLKRLPPLEQHRVYSQNPEIQRICEQINDLTTIPDPPESAKNAFAITLFCMEAAVDSRSKDFLKYAFELYPDRDYLIVTQPHTVAENALFSKFTFVPKKMANTFSHVLYIIHRDYLLEQDIVVTRTIPTDFEGIQMLLDSAPCTETSQSNDNPLELIKDSLENMQSKWVSFSARVEDSVVAIFLITRDVNMEYYKSHFHIQDQILLAEHDNTSHSRLVYSIINPIFEKSARYLLKEVMRLAGKTCLYFEVQNRTVIPTIFSELVHIRSRRFPHFLDRKWDHERYEVKRNENALDFDDQIPIDGADRDYLDEEESPFALCFTTRRLLSEQKIIKNSRIVVVGASDTGISFIEALLSISYIQFTNITLISPGGLPHHHLKDKKANFKAYSTSYTFEELKKLMLESRVQVIDSRVTDIDRSDKNVVLHDGKVVPYDTLILTMGIQDQTLSSLKYCSQGVQIADGQKKIKQAAGVLSIDDPYLYKYLDSDGPLMQALTDRRKTTNCVVYGRTLHAYCFIQGLLNRGVNPKNITLAIPEATCHIEEYDASDEVMKSDLPVIYPDAFDDESILDNMQEMILQKGVKIIKEIKLHQIHTDHDRLAKLAKKNKDAHDGGFKQKAGHHSHTATQANLERVVFKKLNEIDDEEEEDEDDYEGRSNSDHMSGMGGMSMDDSGMDEEEKSDDDQKQERKRNRKKKNELEINCRVLVTCGHRDVDPDVFKSIHDNGLVYNGRLIVDKNFMTTDTSIFAAGSLCEFSNRYKSLSQGRSLRMDRYNGREMGSRLARSVFDIYDPNNPENDENQSQIDELPLFFLPLGQGGILPNDIIYYHIKTTNPLFLKPGEDEVNNRKILVSDRLDCSTGKGHFIKFTFNSIGIIDSVTYMGDEEIILQSLWSFVGLHENYLNQLTERFENQIIPNAVEFLSENWAMALYHEWFGDFCLRMRQGIQGLQDVQNIIGIAFDKTSKERKGLSRDHIKQLAAMLDKETIRKIQEETLEFLKTNMNHLPMYYIPGQEFP